MENFIISWRDLFIGIAVLGIGLYIAEQLSVMFTGTSFFRNPRAFIFSPKEEGEDADVGQQLEQIRQRLSSIEERLAQHDMSDIDAPTSPYLRAIQMARHGRDAESVSASCGISRSEAELIIAMHKNRAG